MIALYILGAVLLVFGSVLVGWMLLECDDAETVEEKVWEHWQ